MFREPREIADLPELADFADDEGGDVESVDLPKTPEQGESLLVEAQKEATEKVMTLIRTALDGVDDYTVFASTALYLHGRSKGLDLENPPGDLDIEAGSEETLRIMRKRFANIPGTVFTYKGKIVKHKDKITRYSGESVGFEGYFVFHSDLLDTTVRYPFEAFYNSHLVLPKNFQQYVETVQGIRALSLEGLSKQYANNLNLESMVARQVRQIDSYLDTEEIRELLLPALDMPEKDVDSDVSFICSQLNVTLDQLKQYYDIKSRDDFDHNEIVGLLSAGRKDKSAARKEKLETLKELRKVEG